MISAIQLAAVLGVPLLILRGRNRGLTKLFGTVAMAYFWGIVAAAAVWLLNRIGLDITLNSDISEIGGYACIGLSIPLLMFSCHFSQLRRLTGPVLLSFGAQIVSVCVVVLVVGRTLGASLPWGRELSAMASGMYTGGTPNFNAIGLILRVDGQTIALGNLADMLVGTVFYIFVLLAAKPLLRPLLDKRCRRTDYMKNRGEAHNVDTLEWHGFHKALLRNLLLALGCVLVGAVVGFALWKLRGGKLTDMLVPCVTIAGTILGLALSFSDKVRSVRENSVVGHYFILVFSFALSSGLKLTEVSGGFLRITGLLSLITVCAFVLQAILSRFLRIDADCTIVTMTAGIYGPAFVPAVTKQLDNEELTAPGLICGAMGYAVGTLLGSGLYLLL